MDYIPAPFDDKDIRIPEELESLKEALAKNVHEVWAAGRLADGWKYGPVLKEIRKFYREDMLNEKNTLSSS